MISPPLVGLGYGTPSYTTVHRREEYVQRHSDVARSFLGRRPQPIEPSSVPNLDGMSGVNRPGATRSPDPRRRALSIARA